MPPSSLALQSLKKSQEHFERELLATKYAPARLSHISATALACECLELTKSICHLSTMRSKGSTAVLMRSLIECAFRSAYLAKNPEINVLSLELTDNLERLNLLDKGAVTDPKVKRFYDRNKEIKKLGAKALSFRGILKELEAENWNGLYSTFSAFSHGQLSALASKFMNQTPDGAEIEYAKQPNEETLLGYYGGTEQLLGIGVRSALNVLKYA